MFLLSKKGWIIILIILIMSILNPSYSDFKEYTGLTGKDSENLHKKYNFFIFSVYENDATDKTYLALLMNFIDITNHPKNIMPPTTIDSTSTIPVDTTYK